MDNIPDIHLFTVTINEMKPMTLELNKKVEQAIPKIIDKVLQLSEELHLKKV